MSSSNFLPQRWISNSDPETKILVPFVVPVVWFLSFMWLLFNGHSTASLPSFLRSAWWSHFVHANQSCAWCDCRTVVCQPCPPSSTNAFRFLSSQPQQQGKLYKRFVFLWLVIPMSCWLTLPCGLFSFHGLLVIIVGWHVWLNGGAFFRGEKWLACD